MANPRQFQRFSLQSGIALVSFAFMKILQANNLLTLVKDEVSIKVICIEVSQDGMHFDVILPSSFKDWDFDEGEQYLVLELGDFQMAEVESSLLGEISVVRFLIVPKPRRIGFNQ